jgi:hypothetical protein
MDFPEVVYAPAYPDPRPGHGGVRFETRVMPSGEIAGVAFRGVRELVAALGPAQPWMAVRLDWLGDVLGAAGIRRILIDPPAAAGAEPAAAGNAPAAAGNAPAAAGNAPAAGSGWTQERVDQLAEVLEDNHG